MEELKNKILAAMNSDFIGDVKFDYEEIEQMKTDCMRFYRANQSSWSKFYKREEICELIVLIVNIAKSWSDESEGRFWTKLFGEIFETSISPMKFYNDFESCFKAYNKTLFHSKENKRMFREVFLFHAFAPENSSESFIRLLWNWYSDIDVINFDYQHNDVLYTQLANYLNKKFGGQIDIDEDVDFEGKTYSINSSFKYLYTQNLDVGIRLLDSIFSNFDDIYFNGKYNKDSYYAERCAEVVEKILRECNIKNERRKRQQVERIAGDYSKISAGYEIDDEGIASIFVPEVRAIDEAADDYLIQIYNDEKLIYSDEGFIVGNDIKRRIKRISIPLSNFIDELEDKINIVIKLSVLRNGNVVEIYNSKKSLYRDFILFKGNRETRLECCKSDASYYLVYAPKLDIENYTNCAIKDINYYTSTIYTKEDDYISTNTQQVFFNTVAKDSHMSLNGTKQENIIYLKDGIEYPVYKTVQELSVVIPKNTNSNSIVVTVDDDKIYPLSSCAEANDNVYNIKLLKINADNIGTHKILISDISKKKLLNTILYYTTNGINVQFVGSSYLYADKTANVELKVFDGIDSDYIYTNYPHLGEEKVKIYHNEGAFVVDLPYIKWRIDDGDWNYDGWYQKIWHNAEFLHNNCVIEIENNSVFPVELFIDDKKIKMSHTGKYLLGDGLTENRFSNENSIYLSINGKKYLLFDVLNRENLDDFEIDIEQKTIDFSRSFVGNLDARFLVQLSNEENAYEFESGITGNFNDDIIDGEYNVKISLVDFFDNKTLLLDDDYIIGNPDKFCFNDSIIVLTKFNRPNSGKVKLQNSYITDLKYLREESIGSVYSGVLKDSKIRCNVEVYKKDGSSLKFYYVKGDDLYPIGYDLNKKCFTKNAVDDKNIIPFTSCYYNIEEI